MKKRLALVSVVAVIFAVSSLGQVGGKLPTVKARTLEGARVTMSKLVEGENPIIVNFWATWCSACKNQLASIADDWDEWVDETGVELYAVSIDDRRNVGKVKNYVSGQDWPFEVLLDTNQDVKRALRFQTVPLTLLVDGKGNIVWSQGDPLDTDELYRELRDLSE